MRPVNGWILVEKIKPAEKTKGGIIIPELEDKKKEKIKKAKVLKISADVLRACKDEKRELPYKEGDIVLIHSTIGIELVPLDKDDMNMFIKFDAVMGVE